MIIEWLALIAINFLVLAPTLMCGIVVDDDSRVNYMSGIKPRWKESFKTLKGSIAFIQHATYGAGLFKNVTQDHFASIVINAINTLLIYKLTGSFIVSLIWLCNPVNNQISIWLNGRRYALAIMFLLLALNFPLFFIPCVAISLWLHVLGVPSILLAGNIWVIFSALGLGYWFSGKKHIARYKGRKKDFSQDNELQKITPKKAIIYVKSIGYYFFHILFPTPRMYHAFLEYFGRYEEAKKEAYSFNFAFYKGLIPLIWLIYEMCVGNYWALFFLLFISPWCGITTVTMNVADRYCSLPAIGLLMVCNKYVMLLPVNYQISIYSVITTIYLLKYSRLYRAYGGLSSFFNYHIEINPSCVESRSYFAQRIIRQEPFKAMALLNDGLKYRPKDFKLLIGMLQVYLSTNQNEKALKLMPTIEKLAPIGEEQETKEELQKVKDRIAPSLMNRKQRRKIKK